MKPESLSVAILGGEGFLGRELQLTLNANGHNVLSISRDPLLSSTENLNLNMQKVNDFAPEVVINCIAKWGPDVSQINLIESNLVTPLKIFQSQAHRKITWIQCNSYFNYFYELNGQDKDEYSFLKRSFVELAKQIIHASGNKLQLLEIRLPHLVGGKQRPNSFLKLLFANIREGEAMQVSEGEQYIPLLHVSDASNAVLDLIVRKNLSIEEIGILPAAQMTLNDLIKCVEQVIGKAGNITRSSRLNPQRDFFEEISFKNSLVSVSLPSPRTVDEVLSEY